MRTLIAIAATALLAVAAAAPGYAQVAAPSLNPFYGMGTVPAILGAGPQLALVPGNPAVRSWDGPSRVGGGVLQSDLSITGFPFDPVLDGDGSFFEAHAAGEMFAGGISHETATLDFDPLLGGPPWDLKSTVLGLAVQFQELVSAGIGHESRSFDDGSGEIESAMPLVGVTVRLAEVIYLGAAHGSESFEDSTQPTLSLERPVTRFGIAYLWRDSEQGVHIEAYRETRDSEIAAPFAIQEEERTGFRLEGIVASILVGYDSAKTEGFDLIAGVLTDKAETTGIAIGYVPAEGLSVVASHTEWDFINLTTGQVDATFSMSKVGLAVLF